MFLTTEIKIDFEPLHALLDSLVVPKDGDSRLVMNNHTVRALTGKNFFDDRSQSYLGYRIIQDESLALGEVVILANYEVMTSPKSKKAHDRAVNANLALQKN